MGNGPQVLATGGGAFLDPRTRSRIRDVGVSVWLRADLDVLVRRTGRHGGRPLLKNGDPRAILAKLMEERYPIYAEADIVIDSGNDPLQAAEKRVADAVESLLRPEAREIQS